MLASGKMVGFIITKDYEAARAFYGGKLGFEFVSLGQFALVMKAGGQHIRISKVPSFTPLQSTVLGWEVPDIKAVVDWLTGRGVAFEKYSFVQDKERGIWTTPDGNQVAWFKDPDGNVLSITEL
jgi:catechol 2,3-dioxygenase-like lactoylglutathione lyase family enzyme